MRAMMEDSMGILDHPSEPDYPSGNDYETMLYNNTAMPRDSLGDMSQAWKPAAEQSIASLQPFGDFATADQEVGAPAAWTANSKSITSHASDADLSGGVFHIASAPPDDAEYQPTNQMPYGQYHLAGNQIPNSQDSFLSRVTEHMEATQQLIIDHVERSDQRTAQFAAQADQQLYQQITESELRFQRQEADAQSKKQDREKQINNIKVELATIRRENARLEDNYNQLEAESIMKYEALEKEKSALEAELEVIRKQGGVAGRGAASVELAVANATASPVVTAPLVQATAKATTANKTASLTKPARSLFKIQFFKFCTNKNIWSPNLVNGGATMKLVNALILQDVDALTKLLYRSMRRLGLSTTNATAAFKVQMQLGDIAGGYETVDEGGVDRWLAVVRLHEAAESDEVPVMKFGWYNYDHRVEATENW